MTAGTTNKPKKRYKRRRTRLSYGPRGLETMRFCFQLGGLTVEQHSRLFGTTEKHSYKLLSSLADQRLLEQGPIQTGGRPRDFHYLSKANASRAIVLGGHEAGLHERRAREQHKLHGLPQNVEHAHARNAFYLCLRDAAAKTPGVEVPRDGMWAESFGGFPLRGSRNPEKVFPDGVFEARFEGLACRYYLEYESRSRPGEVLGKLDSYGAHFRRMLRENPGDVRGWLRPVVFLFRTNPTTVRAAQTVAGAIRADAPQLSRFLAWRAAAAKRGVHAGRLVLFGSLEDLDAHGVLSARYGVLQQYPEGALGVARNLTQVSFAAVAREVSDSAERARGEGR